MNHAIIFSTYKPQLTACFSRLRQLCNEKSTGPSIDLLRGDRLLMVNRLRSLIEKANGDVHESIRWENYQFVKVVLDPMGKSCGAVC